MVSDECGENYEPSCKIFFNQIMITVNDEGDIVVELCTSVS